MGTGLAKPQKPLPALVLACSCPALFPLLLRSIEQQAKNVSPDFGASIGAFLKAYGSPCFVAGHFLMCMRKPSMDVPDWCYILATISLSLAGQGAYRGKPFRTGVLLNGVFLFVFGMLLRSRAKAAGASTLIPILAAAAGVSNTTLGITLQGLKLGTIEATPFPVTLPQHAQVTSSLFGTANIIRFLQLLQQGSPMNAMLFGQFLKVVASVANLMGNGLACGWQDIKVPFELGWCTAAAVAIAAILRPSREALSLRV